MTVFKSVMKKIKPSTVHWVFFSKEVLTSTVVFSGTDLSFPIVQWSSGKGERIDARANSTLGANSLHICLT